MTYSPREFLKSRRPERYSDSVPASVPLLDRSQLEYHLDTLTSRSQEADFARFAHRLAEREVCPNLLPQTGPAGGGDSKVDAETYPVADGLALVWYAGVGREAAAERWAFAFSAMKKWRPKVQSDVAKVAGTARGYAKAFFVTNQFVPDKQRAEVEDKLRAKHGLDVRILDRTWILDKVFGGGHERLAVDELRLTTAVRQEGRKGPRDVRREAELAAAEGRIKAAAERGVFTVATVADALDAADLARSLERPRAEVDGLYARAERLAEEHGTDHQRLECAYQQAWASFFWHEDVPEFVRLYGRVERLARGRRNAYDLELLHTLWMLLHTATRDGLAKEPAAQLRERSNTLTRELDRLASEANRPSTALQARTMKLLMRLLGGPPDARSQVLRELTAVVEQCEGLVGFPLEKLAETLVDLGTFLGDQSAYADLFDRITETTARRKGEVAAARLLLKRGAQELDAGRPYNAIRSLGRSLSRLHKDESRQDAVRALLLCGAAYDRAGLLWAARGSTLAGASLAVHDLWTYSEVTPLQAACFAQVRRLELRLGRVPQVLAWHAVYRAAAQVLLDRDEVPAGVSVGDLRETEVLFDGSLGVLFLKTDLWRLARLARLPDVLDRHGLHHAAAALLFALGHEEAVLKERLPDPPGDGGLAGFMAIWRDQPAAEQMPAGVAPSDGATVELASTVLGCRVTVTCENTSPCVELAESVLAALEAFVATAHTERLFCQEPSVPVRIVRSEFAAEPFEHEVEDDGGRPRVVIRCRNFAAHKLSPAAFGEVRSRVFEVLADLTGRIVVGDLDRALDKLVHTESALDRSTNFTGSFGTVGNVLGDEPRTRLDMWVEGQDREYTSTRSVDWDADDRRKRREVPAVPPLTPLPPSDELPAELRDPERIRHTDMQTVSLIRVPLWDRAGWTAVAFAGFPDGSEPPELTLVFKNGEAGLQILTGLYQEVGATDPSDRLRVSIIRGIDRHHPHHYRVVVGSNPTDACPRQTTKTVFLVSRVQTMTPSTSENLDRFLDSYARSAAYRLGCGRLPPGQKVPEFAVEPTILKTRLHVRQAWEVGLNDLDGLGLCDDDEPVIPPDMTDAPVTRLLSWKRSQHP